MNYYCWISTTIKPEEGFIAKQPLTMCYMVSERSVAQVEEDLVYIHKHRESIVSRFSLCFDMRDKQGEESSFEWVNKQKNLLFQLVFHPAYYNRNGMPVVFVQVNGNSPVINEFYGILHSLFFEQGYETSEIILLSHYTENGEVNSELNIILPVSDDDAEGSVKKKYTTLLEDSFYSGKYICLELKTLSLMDNAIKELETAEAGLLSKRPDQFERMKHLFRASKELELLKAELSIAKMEAKSSKQYLDIFRSQDQANSINQYYYHEYEVLPLWYKRVGHIIKVVMGKRSFKSLFRDNVKKQKD